MTRSVLYIYYMVFKGHVLMVKPSVLSLQRSYREWFASSLTEGWSHPFAVTLTLRQMVDQVPLDNDRAVQNFHHFMNLLNRRVSGNSTRLGGTGIRVVPILEGGRAGGIHDGRLHFHALIDCPRPALVQEFPEIIRDLWSKTRWGYREIEVLPAYDAAGWIDYLTKVWDKPDFGSSIDLINVNLG